jgi:hypothetical protein
LIEVMIEPTARRQLLRAAPVILVALVVTSLFLIQAGGPASAVAAESSLCAEPVVNPVACENSKPGLEPSKWQIENIGDESIQGFATQMSVNVGETEYFKIKTPSTKYHLNIIRLGYYGGDGARMIQENIKPTASLPQTQPACTKEQKTNGVELGLVECGDWAVSANWTVPKTAVSGVYIAQLIRDDVSGDPMDHSSQVIFVVRNDESHAPIVLKTSDETWQAYNNYGGNSLYSCSVVCPKGEPEGYKAAYAVSYNRPFDGTEERDAGQSDPFYAEYQLIRFMERNGYNMTYMAQPDVASRPALLKNHQLFISSGHDEYWSGPERTNIETAREGGLNLAFFSGNEVFWKTRFANSADGSNTPNRTLICYKETHFTEPVDPEEPKVATSSWGDPRFTSGGAGKPDNGLTGQFFLVNSGTSDIKVPGSFAKYRFWKNTQVESLTPSQTLTLSPGTGTLGYEWDVDVDNGFRPAGRIPLSSTTVNNLQTFTDYGTKVQEPTIATHSLSLYRAPSGALVFGAGTVQWSWGLDNTNAWNGSTTDPSGNPPDRNMQQATVNLMAEMGAQPATLMTGLVPASKSTDESPPTATVTSPTPSQTEKNGEMVTVSGTAADTGGGVVAAVEVSTDGGATWHPASGTTSWTYAWNVDGATSATIKARAIDDSSNIGAPSAGVTVPVTCPCSLLGAQTPTKVDAGDNGSITVGVKFQSEISGTISGVRFYKSAANTGTHVGGLWTSGGELLASATFGKETETGWQQVEFSKPVPIKANTTYVVGYLAPKGHYSDTAWQLSTPPGLGPNVLNHKPLRIVPGTESANGVFTYGSELNFPTSGYDNDNYWVDAMFAPAIPPSQVTSLEATAGIGQATVKWTAPASGAPPTSYKVTPYIGATPQTATTVPSSLTQTTISGLTGGTAYTFVVTALNEAGSAPDSPHSNSVTPTAATAPAAPTGVSATGGAASATVKWTAPTNNGGSAITGYKVTPIVGGQAQTPVTAGATATSLTLEKLTVGSSYTFTVAAVNAIGTGAASAPSNAVTPTATSAPGAPTGVLAESRKSGAQVSWTAPSSTGGSPITGYRVTPYQGVTPLTPTVVSTAATSATVGGLTNGTAYTFRVSAVNAIGVGAESSPSAATTPDQTIFEQATPGTVDGGDAGSVELGVRFHSDTAGLVEGIRFYKAAANTGTHIGSLWTAGGELLAEVTFSGETPSGWQTARFSSPVAIQANTTYVAGYFAPAGHYSANGPSLELPIENAPLHTDSPGSTGNGVFAYGGAPNFPTQSWQSSNYWVDVLFAPPPPPPPPPAPTAPGKTGTPAATADSGAAQVSWTAPTEGDAPTSYTVTPTVNGVAQTPTTVTGTPPATSTTVTGLTVGSSYTFTVRAANAVGNGPVSEASNAVVPTGAALPGTPSAVKAAPGNGLVEVSWSAPSTGAASITGYKVTPYVGSTAGTPKVLSGTGTSTTIEPLNNGTAYTFKVAAVNASGEGSASAASAPAIPRATIFEGTTPEVADVNDPGPVVLGVKFTSTSAGHVNGIRFYKSAANTGTHIVALWSSTGSVIAQATATGETATGWQEVQFPTPVAIAANTTYVAGYLAPKGHYSATSNGISSEVNSGVLHAPGGSNGVFAYSSSLTFPTGTYSSTNYFVDVLFTP